MPRTFLNLIYPTLAQRRMHYSIMIVVAPCFLGVERPPRDVGLDYSLVSRNGALLLMHHRFMMVTVRYQQLKPFTAA